MTTPIEEETSTIQKGKHRSSLVRGESSIKEGLFGLSCGLVYGMTSPLVGHPFDTVKTKMQAQSGYMQGGMIRTFINVVKQEGFLALYKGILPPLFGSSIFRAVQFGVYNFAYTKMGEYSILRKEIKFTGGLENRVILSGILASTVRSFIECPLELIKVRKQVGESWQIRSLFKGFTATWMRTLGLMTTFFVLVDSFDRHIPEIMQTPVVGPFIRGGVCSTIGWSVVWPFETIKSQIQAGTPGPKTMWTRFVYVVNTNGVGGLFRGFIPGTSRSLIANGASMIMFNKCQDLREKYLATHKDLHQIKPPLDIQPEKANINKDQ